jgi:hypothetical protein
VKWYRRERFAVSSSIMHLDYPPHHRQTDDNLESVAREVLEAMECLLYLIGMEAASPEQVKTYVAEAKRILLSLHVHVDQDDSARQPYLLM